MNKIGIILNNIGNNQQAYTCINKVNELFTKPEYDCTIFFEDVSQRIINPMCGIMNISDIWKFNGTVIYTRIDHHDLVSNLFLKKNSVLYLYDIEWKESVDYEKNYRALTQAEKLICRSGYHSKAIEKYCGRTPDAINLDFDLEKMI